MLFLQMLQQIMENSLRVCQNFYIFNVHTLYVLPVFYYQGVLVGTLKKVLTICLLDSCQYGQQRCTPFSTKPITTVQDFDILMYVLYNFLQGMWLKLFYSISRYTPGMPNYSLATRVVLVQLSICCILLVFSNRFTNFIFVISATSGR